MDQVKGKTPFIIWTLQRTGGTNLARRLFERSGLLEAAKAASNADSCGWLADIENQWRLHEPFDIGDESRVFGRVTENWIASGDMQALEAAIDGICALQLPMKHCVEMVPWDVTAMLAKISSRHGYKHIFLYREKALNRLLSLHYAKLSGVWGAHFVGSRDFEEKVFAEPLPIEELAQHEVKCNERLGRTWELLYSLGADPIAVKFEEIYEAASFFARKDQVISLLAHLHLAEGWESDTKFASEIIGSGEQGTRQAYSNFKGIDQLEEALKAVHKPTLSSPVYPLEVEDECTGQPLVLHASLDLTAKTVHPDHGFDIGGVLILKEPVPLQSAIYLRANGAERRFQWGIQSPAMGKQFPQGANSSSARFKVSGVRCRPGQSAEVVLKYSSGESLPLFRLTIGGGAAQPAVVNG